MRTLSIIIFNFWALTVCGQTDKYKAFHKSDYPKKQYSIKVDSFRLSNLSIELIQTKQIDNKNASSCRIWLTVRNNNSIVDKQFYNDCEAVGGCSGIFVAKEQTRKDYLILSKFGDYNGSIIIIDNLGKIKSHLGGKYFLSDDNKYLFSVYDSDLAGLTVYNLDKNRLLFSSEIDTYLADFYYYKNKFFAVVSDDVKKSNKTNIVTFDFKSNKLIKSLVLDSYISTGKHLSKFNDFPYSPCNCGRTKK